MENSVAPLLCIFAPYLAEKRELLNEGLGFQDSVELCEGGQLMVGSLSDIQVVVASFGAFEKEKDVAAQTKRLLQSMLKSYDVKYIISVSTAIAFSTDQMPIATGDLCLQTSVLLPDKTVQSASVFISDAAKTFFDSNDRIIGWFKSLDVNLRPELLDDQVRKRDKVRERFKDNPRFFIGTSLSDKVSAPIENLKTHNESPILFVDQFSDALSIFAAKNRLEWYGIRGVRWIHGISGYDKSSAQKSGWLSYGAHVAVKFLKLWLTTFVLQQ